MKEATTITVLTPDLFQRHQRDSPAQGRDHGFAAWMVGMSFVGDAVAIVGALLGAFWLRFHTPMRSLGRTDAMMTLGAYRGHMVFLSITLLLVLAYFGLYATGRPQRLRKVNAMILTGTLVWFLANFGLSFELNTMPIVSRIFLFNSFFCTACGLLFWRWMFDQLLGVSAVASLLQRRILFVGWSEQAMKMVSHIANDSKHPYRVIGCVPAGHGNFDRTLPKLIRRLGDYEDLREIVVEEAIDIVIVSDLNVAQGNLEDLVTLCEKEIVHLQIIPSCFQALASGLHLETTSSVPVLGISRLPLDSWVNQILKRTFDVAGALFGLLMSAPLIAIFTGLVYLESPGPVFYRQKRSGLGGRPFYILKIRSMRLDAERERIGWSRDDDPRRLKIGVFMRKWNIDEIPQFLNVLVGDMSLVGPRPERPEFIVDFRERIPHYNARHGVKPGITGWAQVNGLRGDTDLTERIKCDLFYIERWNFLLDVQIVLMTFFKKDNL